MSQPLHKGVPIPGSVLPQRDKPALGQDAGQGCPGSGARTPREAPSSPAAEAIWDDQAGGFWQRRQPRKQGKTHSAEGRRNPLHPPGLLVCTPRCCTPMGTEGSEGWELLAADGAVTGTRCLGQAGWVPRVPLFTSPSPPCCQQHLRGAPALTRVSFVLPKIVFHGILNRTWPLQSPYPLWQASTLPRNGIKTHPSSSPNLKPWQFNPSASNPNTAGGRSHLLPPEEAPQGKKLSSSPGSVASPRCRRSPTSPFIKPLCIS